MEERFYVGVTKYEHIPNDFYVVDRERKDSWGQEFIVHYYDSRQAAQEAAEELNRKEQGE